MHHRAVLGARLRHRDAAPVIPHRATGDRLQFPRLVYRYCSRLQVLAVVIAVLLAVPIGSSSTCIEYP